MTPEEKAEHIVNGIISFLEKNKEETLVGLIIEKLKTKSSYLAKILIFTPIFLNEEDKIKAQKIAFQLTKDPSLPVEFKTDPSILDGLRIRYKDQVWDFSLSGQLVRLENKLKEN